MQHQYGQPPKKQREFPDWAWIILVIVVVAMVGLIAKSFQSPKPPKPPRRATRILHGDAAMIDQPKNKGPFEVGETALIGDLTITLLSCTESKGTDVLFPGADKVFVDLSFKIENHGRVDKTISSMLNFGARSGDQEFSFNFAASTVFGTEMLGGDIAPGGKLVGSLNYAIPKNWETIEVVARPYLLSDAVLIFRHRK